MTDQDFNPEAQDAEVPLNFKARIDLTAFHAELSELKAELGKILVGQEQLIDLLLVALLSEGHVLLEGVPGVAKTLAVKSLTKVLGLDYARIQFTPDLMPSDVLGTSVFNPKNTDFEFKKGPIFANSILIDEINRAPAKTQAALLEVMEEKQITIDGDTYKMSEPFMVLATQNPIDQEGTYRLPEAQLDRFLFKILVDYPNQNEEVEVLKREHQLSLKHQIKNLNALLNEEKILKLCSIVKEVQVEESLLNYIAKLIQTTRNHPFLYLGASPRASLALLKASKAWALIQNRDFVTPEDIQMLLTPVLRHRIHLTPEREMEGLKAEQVVEMIVNQVEVPR